VSGGGKNGPGGIEGFLWSIFSSGAMEDATGTINVSFSSAQLTSGNTYSTDIGNQTLTLSVGDTPSFSLSVNDLVEGLHGFSDGSFAAAALSGSAALYGTLPAAAQLGLNPLSDAFVAGAGAAAVVTGALGALSFIAYKGADYYNRTHPGEHFDIA